MGTYNVTVELDGTPTTTTLAVYAGRHVSGTFRKTMGDAEATAAVQAKRRAMRVHMMDGGDGTPGSAVH